MTVSSTTRKAGPFQGDGAATIFPFTFKVFTKTDVKVLLVDSNGVSRQLQLDSDFSVALNVNQDTSPGGAVTYPINGSPMQAGYSLVTLGSLPNTQLTDITNSGGFYPQVIEDMVDRATIQIQQLAENVSRAIVVTEAEAGSPVLPGAGARAGTVLGFDVNGNVTLLPVPSSFGAGDLRTDVFVAGVDFVPNVTTALTLSRAPGTIDNAEIHFDANYQGKDQVATLIGTALTFKSAIPQGVSKVFVTTGTKLSIYQPPDRTVGDNQLQWGNVLARTVDSIAALRLLSTSVFTRAFVTGYYTAHDGGGGAYQLDTADTTSADNGGTIIVAADGGRWKLQTFCSRVTAEQFGAKADGATDNTACLQAAINWLGSKGGGVLHFGAGTYRSSTLSLITNVHLQGIGTDHSGHFGPESFVNRAGSELKLIDNAGNPFAFLYYPLFCHSVRINNLCIDGNKANNVGAVTAGIYFAPGTPDSNFNHQSEDLYFSMIDSTVQNCPGIGLYAGPAARGGRVINCYVCSNGSDGIRIQTSDWTITHTLFGLNVNNLTFLGAEACHVTGCDIFTPTETAGANGTNVVINDSNFFSGAVPCNGIWFTSCEFDYAAQHGVAIFGNGTTGIVFQGCRWNSSSINHDNQYSHLAIGATVNNGGVTVANCHFRVGAPPNLAQYDILFANTSNWIRVSNNLHETGSNRTGITNSNAGLRLATGAQDGGCFIDGAGRVTANVLRVSSQNDSLQNQIANPTSVENTNLLDVLGGLASTAIFRTVNGSGYNAGASAMYVGKNTATSRSINAAGTINASGADYAEYEFKRDDCARIAKGQIVGFDADGKLTDRFALAIRFGVKSTEPNLVGGDDWHTLAGDAPIAPTKPADIGPPPAHAAGRMTPEQRAAADAQYPIAMAEWRQKNDDYLAALSQYDAGMAAYQLAQSAYEERVEAIRDTVDRIAYCGKVPCNVSGARPGQYVVPVAAPDGGIDAALVDASTVTFEQYRIAVGTITRIREDGRADMVVKVS